MKAYCRTCAVILDVPWPKVGVPGPTCPGCGGPLGRPPRPRTQPGDAKPKPPTPISPASPEQRAKVAGRPCIVCGKSLSTYVSIDPAHLVKRGQGGCDEADCVVPLCRTFDGGCHRKYDDGELDLLSVISGRWPAERREVQHMLEHMRPVQTLERLGNARTQWGEVA